MHTSTNPFEACRALLVLGVLALPRPALAASGWASEPSGTVANLYSVAWSSGETWVAVGDGGLILRSTDGGVTWTSIPSPVGDALRGVSFHGDIGVAAGIAGRVARTIDGGLHWSALTPPTTRNLYAVSMGTSFAVITGEEGQIFVSPDDGVTWTLHTAGTASNLFGVSVQGSDAVAVGGQGAIVMSTNQGLGWGLTVVGDANTFYYGTSFATGATGWAVGASLTGSVVMKSILSGFVWSGETAPDAGTFTGVSFPTLTSGTAVGFGGAIVHTDDGGDHWGSQTSGTTRALEAVAFRDTLNGIAVGDLGTILRTDRGGVTAVARAFDPTALEFATGTPNPVHGGAEVAFRTAEAGHVRLRAFDALGRQVATLLDGELGPGLHSAPLAGGALPSGVYFLRLDALEGRPGRELVAERKVTLVR